MPLQWSQVRRGLDPLKYTVRTAPGLLSKGKPWSDYDKGARSLVAAIQKFTGAPEGKARKRHEAASSFFVCRKVEAAPCPEVMVARIIKPGPTRTPRSCDGEIQVFHDLFGLYTDFQPRHTRRYLNVAEQISAAARHYVDDVVAGHFPGPEQTRDLTADARESFTSMLDQRQHLESAESNPKAT